VLAQTQSLSGPLLFNRVSVIATTASLYSFCPVLTDGAQILRWNWSRVVLALSFARSTASMAFALRLSVLPLVDSIIQFAFDIGVERRMGLSGFLNVDEEMELQRSTINLKRFVCTKYFECEVLASATLWQL
jgi:hypothetical protein